MPQRRDVVASGVVAFGPGRQVLLVHRPRYDDWSFPKGKLDRGEHPAAAAVRETAEETGLDVRLGPPLSTVRYPNGDRHKTVHYWIAWPVGDHDVSGYPANGEIDRVEWLPYREAHDRLTYPRDRITLEEAKGLRRKTRALVVLRHAKARSRSAWGNKRPDSDRPLLAAGRTQAEQLVPLLSAYDASRVLTSPSVRCVDTVRPWADHAGRELEELSDLSEESATRRAVAGIVDRLLRGRQGAVLCTHRPVLPAILDALDQPDRKLEPGGLIVLHHRKGEVVATEVHERP